MVSRKLASFFSLFVAAAGLLVSIWAMHLSRASDTRAQRMDASEASAEATIIAGYTNEVFKTAEMWQSLFTQAEQNLSSGDRNLGVFRDVLSRAQLPPLSPTRDELDVLARADDDTAGHLALCVKWRTIAQAYTEPLASLLKANDPRYRSIESMYVHQIDGYLSNVVKSCGQAAIDLRRHAVPDPEPEPVSAQGEIERFHTTTPPSSIRMN